MNQITIEVNGKEVSAREGETILAACSRHGVKIPTLCYIEGLKPSGACRLCVVEVEGARGLVPSCSQPVTPNMKIRTHSERAVRARRAVVELLLADHPDDCLYCVRNGRCDLQKLADELGVRQRRFDVARARADLDVSSPAIVRDPAKCILCGKCVRVCEEVQGVAAIDFIGRGSRTRVGTAFDRGLNISSCINCGQCIMVCPTGALAENSHLKLVREALADPERTVVVQHAPAISVSIAAELGLKRSGDVHGAMTAALRRLGFDQVFETSFAADLTIMEEASELVHRIKTGGALPMMTSCSPGWIKYVEQFHPDLIPNLSTCKSPQQMLGAVIKSWWAPRQNLDPEKVYSVAVMPCTAKKFEAARPEMARGGVSDIDAVLTTREMIQMMREHGLDLGEIAPEGADSPFGERSSAGKLFGASGGVMEAAVRTAHWLVTGRELETLRLTELRGMKGVKEARLEIDGIAVSVAVANGLGNAARVLEAVKSGEKEYHFIEVMTCPGGCVGGGGQPYTADSKEIQKRMKELYRIDRESRLRTSHGNREVARLYEEFLGAPLSEKSHHLLHTRYAGREVIK